MKQTYENSPTFSEFSQSSPNLLKNDNFEDSEMDTIFSYAKEFVDSRSNNAQSPIVTVSEQQFMKVLKKSVQTLKSKYDRKCLELLNLHGKIIFLDESIRALERALDNEIRNIKKNKNICSFESAKKLFISLHPECGENCEPLILKRNIKLKIPKGISKEEYLNIMANKNKIV
eukprot:TRINITY_DN325_c0_g1_i1.p1 TRINITY_DN325_c0_g1~~TRINITY_DN325_c0_g1_i1.p1  ORF type:complete len:173 (+),score=49.11 TRINITY_DN325_c0_g1_i1:251-769(+)